MAAGNMYQSSRDRRRGGEQEQVDTRYTKVFVGGLAWETQRDAMRRHFEQYGEIIEAVVITDKATGRSKGYGFVTFRDPEAARRACADATPIIDGRRANCNLASLGAQHRGASHSPFSSVRGNHFRAMGPTPVNVQAGRGGPLYPMYFQQGNYAFQYGPPYQSFGYPYSPELVYQPGMYNPYGGLQYPPQVYSGATVGSSPLYAYVQPSSQGFPMQLPQMMQYGAVQQPYGFVPLSPSVTSTGATVGYSSPSTTGSPRLSSPPQFLAVQNQHFSLAPKSEEQ